MTGARALLRLAARDARRDRWRTLLVVLMVTIPVTGLVAMVAFTDTTTATAEERTTGQIGVADAVIALGWHDEVPTSAAEAEADVRARVAPGSVVEHVRGDTDQVLSDGRLFIVRVTDQRLDPGSLTAGQVEVLAGTPPASSDEAVITSELADLLQVGIGDRLDLEAVGEVEVTGLAHRREWLSSREVFVVGDVLPDELVGEFLLRSPDDTNVAPAEGTPLVVGDDVTIDGVGGDADSVWVVTTRERMLSERYTSGERFTLVVLGGLAGVEVALIAGAAFAVSVRRRQRELGLLAAIGGSQRHVRRVVLLTGAVAAVVGSLVGTALAVGGMVAAGSWLDRLADRVTGGPTFDPVWIGVAVAIGFVSVIAGAWLPARSVARLPVTVALSGRRPTPVPSRRGLAGGVVLLGVAVGVLFAGTAMRNPYVFLLGCVLVVLGAGWTSPWLLEKLGALAPRLPVGFRLAVRDAARYRTRNGPIVTAAMAGLAGTVTVAAFLGSLSAEEEEYRAGAMSEQHLLVEGQGDEVDAIAIQLAAELDAVRLPVEHVSAEVTEADTGLYLGRGPVWGTPELALELGGEAAASALEAGRAVVIGPDEVSSLLVTIYDPELSDPVSGGGQIVPTSSVPGPAADGAAWSRLDHVLLPPELRPPDDADAGWTSQLLVLDGRVGAAEIALARETASRLAPDTAWIQARHLDDGDGIFVQVVISAGVLFGLLLVVVAIALAAAESRGDLRTLGAVGANRRTRRSLAVGRALLLSGLGGVLAVPVGLLPAYVVATHGPSSGPLPFHVPWITIGIVAIGVPAVATLGAALASRRLPASLTRVA